MFAAKKSLSAYSSVQNTVQVGADFEKRWFESVVMVLNQMREGRLDPVLTHVRLIEIRDGLQWIEENLNERLNEKHLAALKSIYRDNIRMLNGAIETKNLEYIPAVISSIKAILRPYEQRLAMAA